MNRTPIQNLVMLKLFIGEQTPVPTEEATATGNPATFTTDVRKALTGLIVPFTPIQSGSGAASPNNVRPITGITGITVYHSGSNTRNPTIHTITFQAETGTVYGGTLDAVAGVLTIEWGIETYDGSVDESWSVESDENFYIMTDSKYVRNTNNTSLICNYADSYESVTVGNCKITNSGNFNIRIGSLIGITKVPAFREWLAEHNVQMVCKLQTPIMMSIDPIIIKTLSGENNLWTDTNGTNTVKYLKKVAT